MDHSKDPPKEDTGPSEAGGTLAADSQANLGARPGDVGLETTPTDPSALASTSDNANQASERQHKQPGSGGSGESQTEEHTGQTQSSAPPSFSTVLPHSIPESPQSEEAIRTLADQHPDPDPDPADDAETPRVRPSNPRDATDTIDSAALLPGPQLTAPSTSSVSDMDNRQSATSAASGRGPVPGAAPSANDSDTGPAQPPSSRPTPKPSIKSMQSETSAPAAPITTSSSVVSLHGNAQLGGPQPTEVKRTPGHRSERSSRNTRRFSGSHATSSHSPASDRVSGQKEREEEKPAPYGVIGVCALDSKARSKPSRNILSRLVENGEFDIIVFGDKVILDEEVENWPLCDYLISFYSDGFPLEKAIAYVKARRPFCVNDVPMQRILWDRRLCLQLLDKIGVRTPPRIVVNRDGGPEFLSADVAKHVRDVSGISLEPVRPSTIPHTQKVELLEGGDVLGIDGSFLRKPFVEKPVCGEDHNITIYFPKSAGGGARQLFRKIGNKSSEYVAGLNVPRAITQPTESFIYEKFLQVENAEDVKAYTVGPAYCHAETRKSPVVDGIVRRNTRGKEVRYVTALDSIERDVASKISQAFGQRVCGFDLLRAGGKSYVIDVNGWSFVKDNDNYYDRSASILRETFFKERARRGLPVPPTPSPTPSDLVDTSKGADFERSAGSAGTAPSSRKSLDMRRAESQLSSHLSTQKPESVSTQVGKSSTSSPGFPSHESTVAGTPSAAPSVVSAATSALPEAELAPDGHQAPPPPKHSWKLKGIVSVIRHADRTPKQKYKFTFHTEPFIALLMGHQEEVLLIGEPALASVMQAVEVAEAQGVEDPAKLRSLRAILAKKSSLAGTKVQIKPMFRKQASADTPTFDDGPAVPEGEQADGQDKSLDSAANPESRPMRAAKRQDSLSGVTMSRITAVENSLVLDKLQLIVKWGGEPTHAARYQSQELGENMRNDFKLLNRQVLDEVHVFSSSERRVTTSAQIFASSFLKKKDLPEDFVKIRKDLLDDSNAAKDETDKVKKKLKGLLREGNERPPQFTWPDKTPEPSEVQKRVVQLMKFLRKVMQYNCKRLACDVIHEEGSAKSNNASDKPGTESSASTASSSQGPTVHSIQPRWCCGEDTILFRERWEKLFAEFCDGEKVDPGKISELYDTMKFDALHNRQFLEWVFAPPQKMLDEEYGVSTKEGAQPSKDNDESRPNSEESKRDKLAALARGESSGKLRNRDVTDGQESGAKSVRRIFRRRSFLTGLRQHYGDAAPPEQYFHLYKSNPLVEQKQDARLEPLRQLYQLGKVLFDFICPQEYGISDSEKLEIGLLTSLPLLKEIVQDLEEMQASDDSKSFIYFTKESHIYTLLNCIFEGGIETKISRSTIPELDYLSQICFELYESETKGNDAEGSGDNGEPTFAYSIRITISPGCHVPDPLDVQLDSRHCISCAPRRSLTAHADWWKVIKTLRAKFNQVKLPKSFIAVNVSDAFTFEDNDNTENDSDAVPATTATAETSAGSEDPPKGHDDPSTEQGPGPGEVAT